VANNPCLVLEKKLQIRLGDDFQLAKLSLVGQAPVDSKSGFSVSLPAFEQAFAQGLAKWSSLHSQGPVELLEEIWKDLQNLQPVLIELRLDWNSGQKSCWLTSRGSCFFWRQQIQLGAKLYWLESQSPELIHGSGFTGDIVDWLMDLQARIGTCALIDPLSNERFGFT